MPKISFYCTNPKSPDYGKQITITSKTIGVKGGKRTKLSKELRERREEYLKDRVS